MVLNPLILQILYLFIRHRAGAGNNFGNFKKFKTKNAK